MVDKDKILAGREAVNAYREAQEDAVKAVKDKLEAFKRAHDKVANAQQFVGLEFKV